MVFWDVSFISLVMNLAIMIAGFLVYRKNGSLPALYFAIAYIFFIIPRISYLMHIQGLQDLFIFTRIVACCIEIYAVYLLGKRK